MSRTLPFLRTLCAAAFLATLAVTPVGAGDPPSKADPAPAAAVDLLNARCPVLGKPVVAGISETVNGAVVHFCCKGCASQYRADPAAYEAALRADPGVAARMDEANAVPVPVVVPASVRASDDKGAEFHDAMRRLWGDHVLWTRLFVVSAVAGLPDLDATTKRLLRNQRDIGDGIAPYYGAEAGAKVTGLLEDHIKTAADLVGALKSDDATKAEAAKKRWFANADEIAALLSEANPAAWPLEAAKAMMREHLDATTDEVAARLRGDWNADVAAYDRVHDQALKMADMLSDGIRAQFPEKFR